jgi:hypothetical protein
MKILFKIWFFNCMSNQQETKNIDYFPCNNHDNTSKLLSLKNLIIDEHIADIVESNGKFFPDELFNNLSCENTFKLNQTRLDSILLGYYTGLPAISVKLELNGKFQVINGRHRVAATIIMNCDKIFANILKKSP